MSLLGGVLRGTVLAGTLATVAATGAQALTYYAVPPSVVYPGSIVNGTFTGSIDGGCSINYIGSKKSVIGEGVYVWAADKNTSIRNSQYVKTRPVLQRWNASTGAWATVQTGTFTQFRTYDDVATRSPTVTFNVTWATGGAYYRVAMQVYWLGSNGTTEHATTVYGRIYRTVFATAQGISYVDTANTYCYE
jgi:hypothetical protein